MIEVHFYKPQKNNYNIHILNIIFPFTFKIYSSSAEYEEYSNKISISIDDISLKKWDYQNSEENEKALFKYVLDKIKLMSGKELEQKIEEITLPNQTKRRPVNLDIIPNPNGYVFNFEEIKPKNKIGF